MGIIPFLGNDSEDDEEDFNSFASNTELSKSGTPEGNEDVAEMHKSRSRKAFENSEQFSGSGSEWRKMTDSDEDRRSKGLSAEDMGLEQENNSMPEDDLQQDKNNPTPGQDFSQRQDNTQEERPDSMPENNLQERPQNNPQGLDEEPDSPEPQDQVSESEDVEKTGSGELEDNIEAIRQHIDSGSSGRSGPSRDDELDELLDRFRRVMDRFEVTEDEVELDIDAVTDEELEDLKNDVAEDLTGFRDTLEEIKENQERLEEKYSQLENSIEQASEEGDISVEDINTVERLESLEDDMEKIQSGSKSLDTSEQVHTQALENEVKELRTDVRELSEAVVTISRKVFNG